MKFVRFQSALVFKEGYDLKGNSWTNWAIIKNIDSGVLKMKRIIILILLLRLSFAFCENSKQVYCGSLKLVIFNENKIEFCDVIKKKSMENDDLWNRSFNFKLQSKGKVDYLILDGYKDPLLLLKSNEVLVLFNKNTKIFIGFNEPINEEFIDFIPKKETSCSSELHEGKMIYGSSNLSNLNLCEPWVEGEKGYGINSEINTYINANGLIFFSGYVSYLNPELFLMNSRPKKIKVILTEKNKEYIFDLKDTPNPQKLDFEEGYQGNIRISIMDIYKGDLYEDTCINSIMCFINFD